MNKQIVASFSLAIMISFSAVACLAPPNGASESDIQQNSEPPGIVRETNGESASSGENAKMEKEELKSVDPDFIFEIYLPGGKTWYLNEKGETIQKDERFTMLLDSSGNAQCKVRKRMEDTGKRDEWGDPEVKSLSALYDLNGAIIRDFEEIDYVGAFGDYIIRRDSSPRFMYPDELPEDYRAALWNYKTQEEIVAGVYKTEPLGEIFLLMDNWGTPIGTMSASGEKLAGFPVEKTYYNAQPLRCGRIVAYPRSPYINSDEKPEKPSSILLSSDFKEICEYPYINGTYYRLYGDFIMVRDENNAESIITPDNEIVYNTPENASIDYFDGELVILEYGDHRDGTRNYSIETVDGKTLAEGFDILNPLEISGGSDNNLPVEKFFGVKEKQIVILNRKAETLAVTNEKDDYTHLEPLSDQVYAVISSDGVNERYALMGDSLNVIVPFGKYRQFSPVYYYGKNKDMLKEILGNRFFATNSDSPGMIDLTDLIDSSGNVIAKDLSSLYYGTGINGFTVKKGFDVGLMDWDGNWIVKRSIFSELADE